MNYPLISEYVQSIKFAEENFDQLSNLRPVLDADGNPVMSSGNFAVVFKMEDKETGKLYAVKCFLRDQEGREESYQLIASELEYVSSSFLTPIQYLENELFVDTAQGGDTEFPVVLMGWVEGITLDKYIRTHIHDTYKLSLAAYLFCGMGSWLLGQEFAHGDLKPDNIMVRDDDRMVLVDYDGMFVPAMRGQKARELGSVDYRHPARTEDVFDGSIDDFSIASIALSLKAISLKPALLKDFGAEDRLLFCAKDYQHLGESECLKAIQSLSDDAELAQLLGLFYIAYARNELSHVSCRLFNIAKPEYIPVDAPKVELSTKITDEDRTDAIMDEYSVRYSRDGLRLLEAPFSIKEYKIKDGTKVVCDNAFSDCSSLCKLVLPSSVTSIGEYAFSDCSSLCALVLPSSVTSIGNGAFSDCSSLCKLVLPSSVASIGEYAFEGCSSLRELVLPSSVTSIGNGAFNGCSSLQLNIQNSKFKLIDNSIIVDTEKRVVLSCLDNKENITIPSSVTSIGEFAFDGCSSLCALVLPSSVTSIGWGAFWGCSSLRKLVLPSSVTSIGDRAFCGCNSLCELVLPSSVTSIGDRAFCGCNSLCELVLPSSVTSIGNGAFNSCPSLQLNIQNSKFKLIDNSIIVDTEKRVVLSCLDNKENITIPSSVTSIGEYAFSGCSSLRELVLPSSVASIGEYAFYYCSSLCALVLPSSVTSIGYCAFYNCSSLKSIIVPKGETERFKELLKRTECDLSIIKEQDE